MHSGLLTLGGEKMSKSLGNIVTIRKVAATHDLEALRLLFLGVHYRSAVGFTLAKDDQGRPVYPELDDAEGRLEYFYRTLAQLAEAPAADDKGPVLPEAEKTFSNFQEAMDDDFNTAAAIGQLYEVFVLANKLFADPKAAPKDVRRRTLARLRRDLLKCGETLGIFQREPAAFLSARRDRQCLRRGIDAAAVEARIQERAAARAAKDFARADDIRATLATQSIELMDGPTGTTWRVV
jgi:cysteinyl-tRNA synthetase